jgi:hypothetical protein
MKTRTVWLAALIAGSMTAGAAPIEYTLTLPASILPTVTLGGTAYVGDQVEFTFVGDDRNVIHGSAPAGSFTIPYAAIYQGTGGIVISNGSQILANVQVAPNQFVVNADLSNVGYGFGFVPGGIGPSGFDVSQLQSIYPAGISNRGETGTTPTVTQYGYTGADPATRSFDPYDLTLASAMSLTSVTTSPFPTEPARGIMPFGADGSADIFGAVYSCYGFNGSQYYPQCPGPVPPIVTSGGDFSIVGILEPALFTQNPQQSALVAEFTARPLNVPEPPTTSLLLISIAGLVIAGTRRRFRATLPAMG